MVQTQSTLLIVKPDAVQKRHVGEIVYSIEQHPELSIVAIKSMVWEEWQAREFYVEHRGQSFYEELVSFMASGLLIAIAVEGIKAIDIVRLMQGSTRPEGAFPDTFRGRFGTHYGGPRNATHASDSQASANRELKLLFEEW